MTMDLQYEMNTALNGKKSSATLENSLSLSTTFTSWFIAFSAHFSLQPDDVAFISSRVS